MLSDQDSTKFEQDPLGFVDNHLAEAHDVLPVGKNKYLVCDPNEARAILGNSDGRYQDHSDFFYTRHGVFGPRESQMEIRRAARDLLRNHLGANGQEGLTEYLKSNLPRVSQWPDTGNHLAYRYLLPILISPDSPPKLRALLDEIVQRAVLANARQRQWRWRRMLLQFRTTLLLSNTIEARRAAAGNAPADLLDVIAAAAKPEHRLDELSEVFLSFLFAAAGSVGFVLAWSVYLMGTHPDRQAPPEWIVQEALRLWPVAWQMGRSPREAHQVAGVAVKPGDDVVVCPYAVQRHPKYWSDAAAFQPQRWSQQDEWRNPAFIAFGHGPHRCIAADLASQLVSDILRILVQDNTLTVIAPDPRPTVAAAMAPPAFTLTLHART